MGHIYAQIKDGLIIVTLLPRIYVRPATEPRGKVLAKMKILFPTMESLNTELDNSELETDHVCQFQSHWPSPGCHGQFSVLTQSFFVEQKNPISTNPENNSDTLTLEYLGDCIPIRKPLGFYGYNEMVVQAHPSSWVGVLEKSSLHVA